jgi:hypothetical protein
MPRKIPPNVKTLRQAPTAPAKPNAGLTPAEQKKLAAVLAHMTPKERKRLVKAVQRLTPEERQQAAMVLKRQLSGKGTAHALTRAR